MSRSYRKPYWTDQSRGCSKLPKRQANRVIRDMGDEDAPANGGAYKKESYSWNISDWRYFDQNNKKASRK